MDTKFITDLFSEWNITKEIQESLENYYKLLIIENRKYNLTNIIAHQEVYFKHFYDSLLITKYINLKNKKIVDIGTGAGFPGLVLKIFYPDLDLTLVEASAKKCNFLNLVVKKLNLTNVKILNSRVEKLDRSYYEKFDFVVTRAVAKLSILAELSAQLLKKDGLLVAMKGSNYKQEIEELNGGETIVGLKFFSCNNYSFNFINEEFFRSVIMYIKDKPTDFKYPRHYGKIKHKPLGK